MDKMTISDHKSASIFLEPVSIIKFAEWFTTQGLEFFNSAVDGSYHPKPLYQWINWFLDWSGYTDFMESKKEVEKNG